MPRNSLLLTAGSSFAGAAFCNVVSCDGDLLRFTISVPFPHSDKHSKCHVAWKPLRDGSKFAKGGAGTPPRLFTSINHFEGGVLVGGMLVASGEAAGAQGVPDRVVPGVPGFPELPCLFPEVEDEVEGDEPGLEDPALGVELPGMPGIVPQGELVGVVVLGVVVLGSIGDGCVLLPGAGVGEVGPGAVVVGGGLVGVAELPEGVTGVPAGVAVLPSGVAVPGV
jgi:hypothetical protein